MLSILITRIIESRMRLMIRIFQKNTNEDTYYTLLKKDLHRTAQDIQDAYSNLENAIEPDLIDCYIYELNAVQMRYKFLLATIKKMEESLP